MKTEKKRTAGSVLFNLIPVVLIAVIAVSAYFFFPDYLEHRKAEKGYEELVSDTITIEETAEDESAVQDGGDEAGAGETVTDSADHTLHRYVYYPKLDIDFDELEEVNEDFVCVIYVPAVEICYPVAKSADNEEYLVTTFYGERNSSGCIFVDAYSSADLTDRNTFILGHNMRNGTMFGSLKKLAADETLVSKHPYFYLYTADKVYKYQIFGYEQVSTSDAIYDLDTDFEDDATYDAFIERVQETSLYTPEKLDADFSQRPRVVTLSTCHGTGHVYNFVVFGVLTAEVER